MTFKRAKELKDSGYEVRIRHPHVTNYPNNVSTKGGWINIICPHGVNCIKQDCEYVEVPTLEELIEFVDGQKVLEDITNDYIQLAINKSNEAPVDTI